jgi:hypothetical protein
MTGVERKHPFSCAPKSQHYGLAKGVRNAYARSIMRVYQACGGFNIIAMVLPPGSKDDGAEWLRQSCCGGSGHRERRL